LMIPLAATSSNGMTRWLGGRNWQRLHRLIYPIGILGVLHYWFHKLAKNDLTQPKVYAVVLGILLGARLVYWLAPRWGQGSVDSLAKRSEVRSRCRTQ